MSALARHQDIPVVDNVRRFLAYAGGLSVLLIDSCRYLLTLRFRFSEVMHQVYFLGVQSWPIIILTSLFTGMVISLEAAAQAVAYGFATFIGGTGADAQLSEVRKEYGVSAQKRAYGSDYVYVHSSFIYLIDRKGLLRALMPYGHSPEDFSHDLTILLKE